MEYKPLQPGQTPTFGTSGDAVRKLQTDYNTSNPGKEQLVPDGLYGKNTQRLLNPTSSLIVSSKPARMQGMTDASDLNNMLNKYGINQTTIQGTTNTPNTPGNTPTTANPATTATVTDSYTNALDKIQSGSDVATQRLINEIKASKQTQENEVNKNYDSYKRGLQLMGIQHNEATFSPDLLQGHMQEAEIQHQSKIQELHQAETKALVEASQAKAKGDLETLKAKMDYVRQIKQDQATELKNYYDTINNASKAAAAQLDTTIAKSIYTEMQKLSAPDQEQFILALSKKLNIPANTVVSSLSTIIGDEEKRALEIADKKSVMANRGSKSSVNLSIGEKKLNDSKGPDGYVDPDVYQQAYNEYPGTKKEFLSKFPPDNWVNPENTTLPQYLRSTKKGGKTTESLADKINKAFNKTK